MITIFDFISDILFLKTKKCLRSIDNETTFSPYIFNRWVSMYSPKLALQSNIANKLLSFSNNKTDLFNLFFNIFDKVPQKKITYFKKTKEEKVADDKELMYANALELSKREIRTYKELLTNLKNS